MYKLTILLLIATLSFGFQCHKNCEPGGDGTIVGKWKLVEYYVDPGDGSATWGPAPATQTYVEFKADGTYETDIYLISGYERYETTNGLTFVHSNGTKVLTTHALTRSTLEIKPSCFEGCGMRFRRQ
jgi:hypothetical protein